jgi:hypothetical protein
VEVSPVPSKHKKEVPISNDGYDSQCFLSKTLIALRLRVSGALFFCCTLWLGLAGSNASPLAAARFAGAPGRYAVFQLQSDANLRQRQVAFLNRIRRADPERRTIERAIFNRQNELALILARGVEMDKIPVLMRSIVGQMAQEFPGQDLTAFAYVPTDPPQRIGTARFNARTRNFNYTREQ